MQNMIYLDDSLTEEELRDTVEEQRIMRLLGDSSETARILAS